MFRRKVIKKIKDDKGFKEWLGEWFIMLQLEQGGNKRLEKLHKYYNMGLTPEQIHKLGANNDETN